MRTIETLCHDSVALCCIAIEKGMRAGQTRPSTHARDRPGRARTTEVFCRSKETSIASH